MAIYLSRKKGGTVATPITPSNSSPAQMTANTPVNPTANGYAIESYDSVTPSSTPTSVSANDIVKIGGSGVIVDSIPTPTSLTPSNTTPATITSGNSYTATANGYAIESYTNLSPSSGAPQNINSGTIYKATTNGKAVSEIYTVSSSDIYPPNVVPGPVFTSDNSGYLYATVQPKVKKGTFTTSGSSVTEFTVNVGFKPDTIIIFFNGASGSMSGSSVATGATRYIYDSSTNSSYGFRGYKGASSDSVNMAEVTTSGDTRVSQITSSGFVWRNAAGTSYNGTYTYIAIKW